MTLKSTLIICVLTLASACSAQVPSEYLNQNPGPEATQVLKQNELRSSLESDKENYGHALHDYSTAHGELNIPEGKYLEDWDSTAKYFEANLIRLSKSTFGVDRTLAIYNSYLKLRPKSNTLADAESLKVSIQLLSLITQAAILEGDQRTTIFSSREGIVKTINLYKSMLVRRAELMKIGQEDPDDFELPRILGLYSSQFKSIEKPIVTAGPDSLKAAIVVYMTTVKQKSDDDASKEANFLVDKRDLLGAASSAPNSSRPASVVQ